MHKIRVVALLVLGCGGAGAGDRCQTVGTALCDTSKTRGVFFCEGGPPGGPLLVAYNCPGPNGCTMSSSRVVCDFHGVVAGSDCPAGQIDKGFCDGKTLFRCALHTVDTEPGTWTTMACANSCTETATTFTCN